MSRVVVLGDLNLDIYADPADSVRPGSESRGGVRVGAGGSAGTFARVAARHGATVAFLGAVGTDAVGGLLERSLLEAGVDPRLLRVDGPSGVVLAHRRGAERSMLCSRGANNALSADAVDPRLFDAADHLHVSGYAILADGPRSAALRAIELAAAAGASVSLDPPPANLIEAFGRERFLAAIRGVNWLFPNEEEGRFLTAEASEVLVLRALAGRYAAGALTLGPRGAVAWCGVARHRQAIDVPLDVNSTGAGDAYAAAFVVGLLAGGKIADVNVDACRVARQYLAERPA